MKKQHVIALFLCVALLALAGCTAASLSSKDEYRSTAQSAPAAPMPEAAAEAPMMDSGWGYDMAEEEMIVTDPAKSDYDDAYTSGGGESGVNRAKIIKNASISLETREFTLHVDHVRQRAEEMGGYVSSSYVSGKEPENYYDAGRYASITVRIPQERMESFLADTRGLATVISENTSGDDITATYYDTSSRLEVYTAQRERVLALLEQAETMEDIIALETELSRLTYEIENLTGSLRQWDDLVDYATVTVDIREIPPALASTGKDSMGTRISDGFGRTLSGMAVFFENALVFLIAASPVIVLLAIVAAVVIVLVRRYGRKQKARMAEQGYFPANAGTYGDGKEKKKEKKNKAESNKKEGEGE